MGPGTIAVSPTGTSCGVGCTVHTIGTTVTLAPQLLAGARVMAWGAPCNATLPGQSCTFTLETDTEVQTTFLCTADVIVDATTGNDGATGVCGAPLKTLRQALTAASVGQTIRALPGVYDVANGEIFPIVLDGRTLVGDEETKGETTRIVADGAEDGVSLRGTAVIAGLKIEAPGRRGVDVSAAGSSVTVRNNQVTNSAFALWFGTGGTHTVTGNRFFMNSGHGVAHISGSPSVKYEGNHIYMNNLGVEADTPNGDWGGGALGSTGGNHFYCNMRNDLWIYHSMGEVLRARNNFFDHSPPTSGADGGGIDAYQASTGPIDTFGAQVTTVPCP